MYAAKGQRSSSAQRQTQDVLVRVLREREPELGAHLNGVATAGGGDRPGGEPAAPRSSTRSIRAAELHDIGKIAIPDRVLHKLGPLDEDEWALMRTHTTIGERILAAAPAMAPVAALVRSSHERWDGDGYPDRLAGEQIPLGSRIIFVCDAYEAMTESRSYRDPISPEDALEELRRCAGTQFDPQLVELFADHVFPLITGQPAALGARPPSSAQPDARVLTRPRISSRLGHSEGSPAGRRTRRSSPGGSSASSSRFSGRSSWPATVAPRGRDHRVAVLAAHQVRAHRVEVLVGRLDQDDLGAARRAASSPRCRAGGRRRRASPGRAARPGSRRGSGAATRSG